MIIDGTPKGSGATAWADTFVDPNVALPSGNITHIGVHSASPSAGAVKIASGTNPYEIVASADYTHPGGGWHDEPIPFTVPAGNFHMAAYIGGTTDMSVSASRRYTAGEAPQGDTRSYAGDMAPMPVLRAVYDGETPNPDPDPPQERAHYVHALLGQSNGQAAGQGASADAFIARLEASVPIATHELINTCIGSTFITDWLPSTTALTNAITAINAALVPGARLASIMWWQGEAETRPGREAMIVDYPDQFRQIADALEVEFGPVPLFVVEHHGNLDPAFSRYVDVQRVHRMLCRDSEIGVGATLVSAADQTASFDGGLHLTEAAQTVVMERLADAVVEGIWPR